MRTQEQQAVPVLQAGGKSGGDRERQPALNIVRSPQRTDRDIQAENERADIFRVGVGNEAQRIMAAVFQPSTRPTRKFTSATAISMVSTIWCSVAPLAFWL